MDYEEVLKHLCALPGPSGFESPVAQAAEEGGFCILDEINMAKNEAMAVMHSVLDYRRLIDVPGYQPIPMHPATRFIASMNYGYAGTRELNEALVSRFVVIRMPALEEGQLRRLLLADAPGASEEDVKRCVGLFLDLNEKAINGEISTRPVDMRGMVAALRMMTDGSATAIFMDVLIANNRFCARAPRSAARTGCLRCGCGKPDPLRRRICRTARC